MKVLRWLAVILGIIIIVLLGVLIFYNPVAKAPTQSGNGGADTGTSTAPGGPVVSSDGRVAVTSPAANGHVHSPLTITGTVTGGGWFFEASFPVKVLDADGTVLGIGTAQAQGDWMTTDTVPFSATVSFVAPQDATGTVVLSKDNPSGDPAKDLSLSIPVKFY
jgi:Immunoglobulin-like domain of bacterial spore germination